MDKVTFCMTKAGNGFKIVVDGNWLYVSREHLMEVVRGKIKSCQFKAYI